MRVISGFTEKFDQDQSHVLNGYFSTYARFPQLRQRSDRQLVSYMVDLRKQLALFHSEHWIRPFLLPQSDTVKSTEATKTRYLLERLCETLRSLDP